MSKTIYLISVIYNLSIVVAILFAVILGILILLVFELILYRVTPPEHMDEDIKLVKKVGAVNLIILAILVLVPGKKEMYAMTLLKDHKPNQIYEMTKEELKEGIDYFFEKLDGDER